METEDNFFMEPPNFYIYEEIFSLSFHPTMDCLAFGTIGGHLTVSPNQHRVRLGKVGAGLVAGTHDRRLVGYTNTLKEAFDIKTDHKSPIFRIELIDDNLVASGDDDGVIKIWDVRTQQVVFDTEDQAGATCTGIRFDNSKHYMLSTNGGGTLGVYDLRVPIHSKEKLHALSDEMEEELTCLEIVKGGANVAVGTSEGVIQMYEWDWYGDCKDRITKHSSEIESLVKYDEETLIAGCEDGWVRFYDLAGHKFRVFENHAEDLEEAMAIHEMALSRCRRILASVTDDRTIRFYDVSGIREFLDADKTDAEATLEQVVGDKGTSQKKQALKTKNTQFFQDF